MSAFITTTDYNASIHAEILDALIRSDEAIVEVCEDRATAEMKGYMSKRYDCDIIFAQTGDNRNQLILMMALDIAIYHLFCIHNPQKLSQVRKDRYDRAVSWLKAVNTGAINIDGAPMLEEEQLADNSRFIMASNPKRQNHL